MIEWRDEGILLRVRPHGETAVIADIFTRVHGRHAGVVRGGIGRRLRPSLQPGTVLDVTWRARLDDHIGAYSVEPVRSSAAFMADRGALAVLNAMTALVIFCLAERDPHAALHERSLDMLDRVGTSEWAGHYLRWERALLEDLGYALDLTSCAVTGTREELAFVSPRTGRAVSRGAAGEWAEQLLPLPPALLREAPASPAEVLEGLRTTGHFLGRFAAELQGAPLPPARDRLLREIGRLPSAS